MSGSVQRLDLELVRRGLARSRGQARELIHAGAVLLDGRPTRKPAAAVGQDQQLGLCEPVDPWVSRAAYKLVSALDTFGPRGLRVEGRRCIDVGASTGGFTQVLLSRGAAGVVALDVGRDQLAPPVAHDPRVVELSGVNVRDVAPADVGGVADLVVADLSFISLGLVLAVLASLTASDGDLVVLVKPQFEVGRSRLGKGGVVRSATDRAQAVVDVVEAARRAGLQPLGIGPSPIRGTAGNAEYLLWLTPRDGGGLDAVEVKTLAARLSTEESA